MNNKRGKKGFGQNGTCVVHPNFAYNTRSVKYGTAFVQPREDKCTAAREAAINRCTAVHVSSGSKFQGVLPTYVLHGEENAHDCEPANGKWH